MGAPLMMAGLGFGALLAVGLALMVFGAPIRSRDLRDRVAPYVIDRSPSAVQYLERRGSGAGPWTFSNVIRRTVRRLGPTTTELARRSRRAGLGASTQRIQLEIGLCALGAAAAVAALSPLMSITPAAQLAAVATAGVAGGWARVAVLSTAARRRTERIEGELPGVLELMTIAVASGESLPGALHRVARMGSGPLSCELTELTRKHGLGAGLSELLEELDTELGIPGISRWVAQLRAALERGAPIADVLRAQTTDERTRQKHSAMEKAGRQEIAMMFPLVFLILPTTVLFAIWPGILTLNAGVTP
ncbi:MAG TPA: type II secretion system F family protein [Microbacteriaceae bacterium]|nr:type II secretion system F family protein [Microbacteriaceae bacterium]